MSSGVGPSPADRTTNGTDSRGEGTDTAVQNAEPAQPPSVRTPEPEAVTREAALVAMTAAYRGLTDTVAGLAEPELLRPTRAAGWAVVDVLYHVMLDAQRALVALATPEERTADTDYVTYWRPFAGGPPPSAARHARQVRIAASAQPPTALVREWETTAGAAVRAARATPADSRLVTQGHVLALPDLLATFAVEAGVHVLDLRVELDDPPPVDPAPLELIRRTLDGLLGAGTPRPDWDDERYALKGTGRIALSDGERAVLGPAVAQFPLFG